MRRAILFFVLLSSIIALVVMAVLFLAPSRVALLPNGARVEFLGTAVGPATFTTEKSWQRVARKVLPPSLASRIPPASSGNCSRGSNSVTYYFRVTDPTGAAITTTPWATYSAEDETGFRFDRGGGYCSSASGSSMIYGLIVESYPRRQTSFRFHFHNRTGVVLATLQVPNPVRGPFPQWQPQALPQTQTLGPVTLTLQSLQEYGNPQWRGVGPKWKLTSSDPAWASATVRHANFFDASGKEGRELSRRETAWQVRAIVFRERPEDFAAAERLVVTNLSIPAAGTFVAVDHSGERQGVKLTALVIAGAGQFCLTNGVQRGMSPVISNGYSTSSQGTTRIESWGSVLPFLLIEAQNVQPDDEIRVRLLDERGREIKLGDSSGYDGMAKAGRLYKRSFTPPDDAKFLTLEVLVNRPLRFEFMVNPADVQPPQSPPSSQ